MSNNEEWQQQQLNHIKNLKRLSPEQKFFLAMAELPERTEAEDTQFKAVCAVLKAAEQTKAKRRAFRTVVRDEEVKARKEADKKRTHELIQSALLMVAAGVVDSKTGTPKIDADELVGTLLGIANLPADHEKRGEWKQRGKVARKAYTQQTSEKKESRPEPQNKEPEPDSDKTDSESRGEVAGQSDKMLSHKGKD